MAAERAILLHAIAGRARLRFDEHLDDEAFFTGLRTALARCAGVREVTANARSGSLLILHDGELAAVLDYASERGLFETVVRPHAAPMRQLRGSIDRLDETIAVGTGDAVSLGKLTFVAMIGAGFWQARNGHFLPAGMTLFNYALKVMDWVAEREPENSSARPKNVSGS